jgi:HD-GYP domain-containing protein (c-di-GMP phosphodiesterase class II)/DNA-binding CsgD family transcriptional regulator
VELAEVVAAIALSADLGLGQPLEHMLRTAVLSMRIAERVGATPEECDATYWVTLFMTAGCIGTSWELAHFFGDDISFRAGMYELSGTTRDIVRYLFSSAGSDREGLGKTRARIGLVLGGMTKIEQSFIAHCAINAVLADRLSLGPLVATGLLQTFCRWDGKGLPKGIAGADLTLAIRIAVLTNQAEVVERDQGFEKSTSVLRNLGGKVFDPTLVELWCDEGEKLVDGLEEASTWDGLIAASPRRTTLTEHELDDCLELMADYADLKSPWFSGHSRGVAGLAAAAARKAGLPESDVTTVRRAALVHDIGRTGIPNTIWDKPGPLTDSERERVRLHAYYTDRVLHRAGKLSVLGSIAASAHERSNGSGYPKGIGGATVPLLGRFLEAADAYQAMCEDRPHRPALQREVAASELRRGAREGELDGSAVDAVLAVTGHPVRRKPTAPDGLTRREVEVLVLASRGCTVKVIGGELGISPKTAGNHIERIYTKIGVGSRAEAAMYAMQHGLLPAWV